MTGWQKHISQMEAQKEELTVVFVVTFIFYAVISQFLQRAFEGLADKYPDSTMKHFSKLT